MFLRLVQIARLLRAGGPVYIIVGVVLTGVLTILVGQYEVQTNELFVRMLTDLCTSVSDRITSGQ